jgi:hypothetical protein
MPVVHGSQRLDTVTVVAKHGNEYYPACRESLGHLYLVATVERGNYPTGAYLDAYNELTQFDNFLFIQDSMVALVPDYVAWFREQMPELGAVAWGKFAFGFDNSAQREQLERKYQGPVPEFGLFGPIFFTNRASLDLLKEKDLLPPVPTNKLEAQGSERAWAMAFHAAGLPLMGPTWDKLLMEQGLGPFKKTFANRQ